MGGTIGGTAVGGGDISMVTEVSEAGAARLTCAVT